MKNSFLSFSFISSRRFCIPLLILPRILPISLLVCLIILPVNAQNQPPNVTNVRFTQREDAGLKVDVYYDVNDPDGNIMTVSMKASSDNGVTWNFPCNNITGDVGAGITSGTNKHVVWDFAAEHPQTFGDQFRIKIIADDTPVMNVPCRNLDSILYESKYYHTVQIGNQCWLKENLDVGIRINGNINQTSNGGSNYIEKYCYSNLATNCNTYGGLYQWNEAMKYVTTQGAQGICPTGWHIPTLVELQTLAASVGNNGNKLKRQDQGSGGGLGTNTSGFSAVLAGQRDNNTLFYYLHDQAYFWTSTMYNSTRANYMLLYSTSSIIDFFNDNYMVDAFSIRCVKN